MTERARAVHMVAMDSEGARQRILRRAAIRAERWRVPIVSARESKPVKAAKTGE